MKTTMEIQIRRLACMAVVALPLAAQSRFYVANNLGDTVDVIDPATNKVVQTIPGIPRPHGITFSRDGKQAFISSETENALYSIDTASGKILKKLAFSPGRANVPTLTKDGKRIFVCMSGARDEKGNIANVNGRMEVVDAFTFERIKAVPMKAIMHDCYTTPDGKYIIGGSFTGQHVAVVDAQTDKVVWTLDFDRGVTTIAIETNADGSTRRLFANLNDFRGFAVIDFATHKEVQRVRLPEKPGPVLLTPPLERRNVTPTHGSAISPDGKTLAVGSRGANGVFFYSLPEVKLRGFVATPTMKGAKAPEDGGDPGWVAFSQDGKNLYVASAAVDIVSVIDVATLKETARIPVGRQPDHIEMVVLPKK